MQPVRQLMKGLSKLATPERYLFTPSDMRALVPDLSVESYRALLSRAVQEDGLIRVCRGLYLYQPVWRRDGLLLFHAASRLRAEEFNYISLETALSDVGVISQVPISWITVMSSGRTSTISCGNMGTIEFVHTTQRPAQVTDHLAWDQRCRMWRADVTQALRDMRATHRSLDLIDWNEVKLFQDALKIESTDSVALTDKGGFEAMDAKVTPRPAVFEGKQIRKVLHDGSWWFVVEDVVAALIESRDPKQYVKRMKLRDPELNKGWVQIVPTLFVPTEGGPQRLNCASTEGIFRIIQSIPSPKAEPFKRWLARIGKERLDEIENPELAMDRMQELYEKKGYPKDWIDKRMRGIAVRHDLTDEWQNRGAETKVEFAILTNEIMQGAFGLNVDEYKQVKDLERENLRDHMTDMELILTMLAEATTTTLHRDRDSQGIKPLKKDAKDGGAVAGRTRKDIERQTGKPVISGDNFKQLGTRRTRKLNDSRD